MNYLDAVYYAKGIGRRKEEPQQPEKKDTSFLDDALEFGKLGLTQGMILPNFLGGLATEAAGNVLQGLGNLQRNSLAGQYAPEVADLLQSLGEGATDVAETMANTGTAIPRISYKSDPTEDTPSKVIDQMNSAYTGAYGNIARFLHADKVADIYGNKADELRVKEEERPTPDFTLDYLLSGLPVDFGELAGSMAAILPATYALKTPAVAGMLNPITREMINRGMYGAAKVFSQLAPQAVRYGLTSAPLESGMEGGQTRANLLAQGYSDEEATKQSAITALKNMALLLPTNTLEGLAVFSPLARAGKLATAGQIGGRGLLNTAQQSYEEFAQEGIQNAAEGKPYSYNPFNGAENQYEAAKHTAGPAALMGLVGGGVGAYRNRNVTGAQRDNEQNWRRGSQENISNDDYGTRAEKAKGANGIDNFMRAISGQESGDNYDAVNNDSGATGAFQIMPENWSAWAQDAGLSADAPMTPENQNLVARNKMQEYYNKFGNWRDVAIAWYGGEGAVGYSEEAKNRPQGEYPSINEYADSVMSRFEKVGGDVSREGIHYLGDNGKGEGNTWQRQNDNVSLDGAQPDLLNAIDVLGKWFYDRTGKKLVVTAGTNGKHADGEHSHTAGWKVDVNDWDGESDGYLVTADGSKGSLTDEFIKFGQSIGLGMNWEGDHIDVALDGTQWDGSTETTNFGGFTRWRESPKRQATQPSQEAESSQQAPPKPLFDITREDNQAQDIFKQFAEEKALNSNTNEEINFFDGMFDADGIFQNTKENRDAIRRNYADEFVSFAQNRIPTEQPQQIQPTQSAPTKSQPKIEEQKIETPPEDSLLNNDDFKGRMIKYLQSLESTPENNAFRFEIGKAWDDGNQEKVRQMLESRGVSTTPIQPDPVTKNKPPENVLPKPKEKLSEQEKLINVATKTVPVGNKHVKARKKQGKALMELATQNNIEISQPEMIALQNGSTKAVQKWRDELLKRGLSSAPQAQETSQQENSQMQTPQENSVSAKILQARKARTEQENKARAIANNLLNISEDDESFVKRESPKQSKTPYEPWEDLSELSREHDITGTSYEKELQQRQAEEERQRQWKAKQDRELAELKARQAENKRLAEVRRKMDEEKVAQQGAEEKQQQIENVQSTKTQESTPQVQEPPLTQEEIDKRLSQLGQISQEEADEYLNDITKQVQPQSEKIKKTSEIQSTKTQNTVFFKRNGTDSMQIKEGRKAIKNAPDGTKIRSKWIGLGVNSESQYIIQKGKLQLLDENGYRDGKAIKLSPENIRKHFGQPSLAELELTYPENEKIKLPEKAPSGRARSSDEVFTPPDTVNHMLDLAEKEESDMFTDPTKTYLEPAAGEGNITTEILRRKLNNQAKAENKSIGELQMAMLRALSSVYSVELMEDNVGELRKNVQQVFLDHYRQQTGKELDKNSKLFKKMSDIINANNIQGNFLELTKGNAEKLDETFKEWKDEDFSLGNSPRENNSFAGNSTPSESQETQNQKRKSGQQKNKDELHAKLKTDTHPFLKDWLDSKIKEAATKEGKQARAYLKQLAEQDLNDTALDNAEENLRRNKEHFNTKSSNPTAIAAYDAKQKESEQKLHFNYPDEKFSELKQRISQMSDKELQAEATTRLERDFDRNFLVEQEAVTAIENLIRRDESNKQALQQTEKPKPNQSPQREEDIVKNLVEPARLTLGETHGAKLEKILRDAQKEFSEILEADKYPEVKLTVDFSLQSAWEGMGTTDNADVLKAAVEREAAQLKKQRDADSFPDFVLANVIESINDKAKQDVARKVVKRFESGELTFEEAYKEAKRQAIPKTEDNAKPTPQQAEKPHKESDKELDAKAKKFFEKFERQDNQGKSLIGATLNFNAFPTPEDVEKSAPITDGVDGIAKNYGGRYGGDVGYGWNYHFKTTEDRDNFIRSVMNSGVLEAEIDRQQKAVQEREKAVTEYKNKVERIINGAKEKAYEALEADKYPEIKSFVDRSVQNAIQSRKINTVEKAEDFAKRIVSTVRNYKDAGRLPNGLLWELWRNKYGDPSRVERKYKAKFETVDKIIKQVEDGKLPLEKAYEDVKHFLETGRRKNTREKSSKQGKDVDTTIRNYVDQKDLTPQQQLLQDFGRTLSVRVVFFKGDSRFHGQHSNGITYLNVDSNMPLGKVFWHESMHWLKANNSKLYQQLAKAVGITDEQRQAYLDRTKRNDLPTDEAIDEEIIADQFEDVAKRSGLLQSISGKNRGLIGRVIQWLQDTMKKFVDYFRNPQGKLTTAQAQALTDEFGKIANELTDPSGEKIFRYNRRTHNIELADGHDWNSIEHSDNRGAFKFNERPRINFKTEHAINFSVQERIQAQENSGTTQVSGTKTMYVKAIQHLRNLKEDIKTVLDYGAGLGLGTDAMRENNPDLKIDSYEPNPQRWQGKTSPTFTDNTKIQSQYDTILNTNVLNVVEPEIRNAIVRDIGSLLKVGGKAMITTRSWKGDIEKTKNYTLGDEPHSVWIPKNVGGKTVNVYQKGFDGNELLDYVSDLLGEDFKVEKVNGFGKSGVIVTRIANSVDTSPETKQDSKPKYSIDASDNSNESTLQRIRNKITAFIGSSDAPSKRRNKRITQFLEKLADIRILTGHIKGAKNIDVDEFHRLLKSKKAYDWENILPEIGGMLAKSLNLNDSQEMRNYFTDWLLTGAPNNNSAEAKAFQQAARNNPAMFEILQNIRNEFEEFNNLEPIERYKEGIVGKDDKTLMERLGYFKDNWREEFIDDLRPIERMFEQVVEKAEKTNPKFAKWLKETVNPYEMARLLRGMDSVAEIMIGKIGTSPSERINEIRANLAQAYPNVNFSRFKPIAMILEEIGALNGKGTYEDFSAFCVAKLDKEMYEKMHTDPKKYKDITPYGTEADADAVIKQYEKQFGQAQKDLVHYSNTMLAIRYDAGLMSKDQYDEIRSGWQNYIPTARVFDENEDYNFINSLKPKKGSKRAIRDAIPILTKNTHSLIKQAERNKIKCQIAQLARCGQFGQIIAVTENSNPNPDTDVAFYEYGKKYWLNTPDPSIVRALSAIQSQKDGTWIVKAFNAVMSWFKGFQTFWNPDFSAGNIFRDSAAAYIHNKHLGYSNPFMFFADVARIGFKGFWTKDTNWLEWQAMGGSQSSYVSEDVDYVQRSISDITESGLESFKKHPLSYLLDRLQYIAEASETATRLTTYVKARDALAAQRSDGKATLDDKRHAALASRNATIDFAKAGTSTRKANRVFAFANAAVQDFNLQFQTFSPAKIQKAMKGDKQAQQQIFSAGFRLLAMGVIPTLIQFALMHRDDDKKKIYRDLHAWEKETYWYFGDRVHIPKSMDIGIRLTSAITDEFLKTAIDKDPAEWRRFRRLILDAAPGLTATLFTPLIETYANYSLFRDAPIVPAKEQHLPDRLQYGYNTSPVAKFLGEQTGFSPRKIDYLISGYLGFMGRFFTGGTDELPIARRFVFEPYRNPKIVKDYYEALDEQASLYNGYKLELQQGKKVKPPEDFDPALYQRLKVTQESMRKLSNLEKRIQEDEKLSDNQRKEKLRELELRRVALCEKVFNKAR